MSLKTLKKKKIFLVTPALKCLIFINHFFFFPGSSWNRGLNFIQKSSPLHSFSNLNLPGQLQAQQYNVYDRNSPTWSQTLSVLQGSCGPGVPSVVALVFVHSYVLCSPLI